jgi:sugar phosphate isomerase/epimerase
VELDPTADGACGVCHRFGTDGTPARRAAESTRIATDDTLYRTLGSAHAATHRIRRQPLPRDSIDSEAPDGDLSRRRFLQTSAAGLFGVSALPYLAPSSAAGASAALAKMGVQLYTVRDAIKSDMDGTLRRLAAIGFSGVETAFWPSAVTLAQASSALRRAGLTVSSCHVELPVGDNRQTMLDTAKAFDATRMIWHGWPEDPRYRTLEGTKALAAIYNQSHRIAKDNGLQFGLHNHWWEFRNQVGGRYVFEVLLEETDPDIFFEVDTYWVKVAGHNPAEIIRRLGARAPLLHIKDGPARYNDKLAIDNPDPMTAVGQGTQDFPAVVRAANGQTEWMIVEMDKTAGDVFTALEQSHQYLVTNALARGRKTTGQR